MRCGQEALPLRLSAFPFLLSPPLLLLLLFAPLLRHSSCLLFQQQVRQTRLLPSSPPLLCWFFSLHFLHSHPPFFPLQTGLPRWSRASRYPHPYRVACTCTYSFPLSPLSTWPPLFLPCSSMFVPTHPVLSSRPVLFAAPPLCRFSLFLRYSACRSHSSPLPPLLSACPPPPPAQLISPLSFRLAHSRQPPSPFFSLPTLANRVLSPSPPPPFRR
mmetsp:Transcript_33519/g.85761  ORF Transcript_33519/g.85761 Transcript_33519/m.85761 type:complete len:215 (+) Transcript_33519:2109-2753(+)